MSLTVEKLLSRNKDVAQNHKPFPLLTELPNPPKTIIVACADPRCIPEKFVNLEPGEVIVMRTVGGHVGSVLKDIITLDAFIGIDEVMIVHHTDCGGTYFTNEGIKSKLKEYAPDDHNIDDMDFGAFKNIEQSVRDDIDVFRSYGLVRNGLKKGVSGFVLDLKTGVLNPVKH